MPKFSAYNEALNSLDFLLRHVVEGWSGSDAHLGSWVREHVQHLRPALIVLSCFQPPLDFPPELRHSDFGRLTTVIHAARRTALINHERWFRENGGWAAMLTGDFEGFVEGRSSRPGIDPFIAHAVIGFMRLLKEERAAENRRLIDQSIEAMVPDMTVGGSDA